MKYTEKSSGNILDLFIQGENVIDLDGRHYCKSDELFDKIEFPGTGLAMAFVYAATGIRDFSLGHRAIASVIAKGFSREDKDELASLWGLFSEKIKGRFPTGESILEFIRGPEAKL